MTRPEDLETPGGPPVRRAAAHAAAQLEAELAERLSLPRDWRIVATASGPAALRVLMTLERLRAGRPLRWLAPPIMDSRAATVSTVARARRLDCNAVGVIDAGDLARIDPESFDALVVSDPFGLAETLEPAARLCRRLGKAMIVEGFAAFDSARRARTGYQNEALCLGPERPWGTGALGAALVHADDEADLRSLARGEARGRRAEVVAARCTPSEPAVTAARAELATPTRDADAAHRQYERLATLAGSLGWTVLGPPRTRGRFATPTNLPLLAPRPLDRSRFAAGTLALRPAGPSPDPRCTVARSLHARLVLVPCDAALADVSDDTIRAALRSALPARSATARSAVRDFRRLSG